MQIRAVSYRQRDSPTDARTASERSDKTKVKNERTESFRAVLMRIMKEGGTYDKNT
mgnify:CR=1 FL=1